MKWGTEHGCAAPKSPKHPIVLSGVSASLCEADAQSKGPVDAEHDFTLAKPQQCPIDFPIFFVVANDRETN
jgi:hypothetical protein